MEVRDSDMPDEAVWSSFFDPQKILGAFGLDKGVHDLVEFGCGYGTFTLATARMASGTVYSFDINPEMIRVVRQKCRRERVTNVRLIARDFVAKGTGLPSGSIDAALLFNILHHDEPAALVKESLRILKPGGRLAVIHWNHNSNTPFGPVMAIRPRPEECVAWGRRAGFAFDDGGQFNFPPCHYGLLLRKPSQPLGASDEQVVDVT